MRRGYADTRWGQVHYRSAGERGSWVFLLHLTPFSSRQFEHCLPFLGESLRAYALDTPGYGLSDAPPGPTTVEHYAEWLLEAINTIAPEGFALCGFSTGAAIALDIARRAPERVTHLVLSTTPLMPKEELQRFSDTTIGVPAMQPDGSHFMKAWAGRQGVWGADLDMRILHAATSDISVVYDRFHWGLMGVMKCDVEALLRQVTCPTLFLTGELDAHVSHNRAASECVPRAVFELLPGATAPICATQPEAYARRVEAFIANSR